MKDFLENRKRLNLHFQSLFDFLYATGCRVSEALKIETRHFNPEKKTVFIPTLKNPSHPLREVRLVPTNRDMLSSIEQMANRVESGPIWSSGGLKLPRWNAWYVSKKYFGATTHSFRHTHATTLVRDYGANLHELMQEMGWSDPKPAMIYVSYSFGESLDKKIAEYQAKHKGF